MNRRLFQNQVYSLGNAALFTWGRLFLYVSEDTKDDHAEQVQERKHFEHCHGDHLRSEEQPFSAVYRQGYCITPAGLRQFPSFGREFVLSCGSPSAASGGCSPHARCGGCARVGHAPVWGLPLLSFHPRPVRNVTGPPIGGLRQSGRHSRLIPFGGNKDRGLRAKPRRGFCPFPGGFSVFTSSSAHSCSAAPDKCC